MSRRFPDLSLCIRKRPLRYVHKEHIEEWQQTISYLELDGVIWPPGTYINVASCQPMARDEFEEKYKSII